MTGRTRGILFLMGFLFLWAAVEMLGAMVLARYSALQVVWTRYFVHLILMLAIFAWREPGGLIRTRRPAFQLLRSMMMLIMPLSWVLATRMHSEAVVYGGFWSAPLLIILLSAMFLGERPRWELWVTAAVGGLAAAAIFSGLVMPSLAEWLPLIGMTASFSIYVVMTRSLRHESTRTNLFYTAFGVFVALTPVMPMVWQMPSLADLPILAGIGGLGLVALWFLDIATASAPLKDTAPLILAQVPLALGLGWIAEHHFPDRRTLFYLTAVCLACITPFIRIRFGFRARESQ